MRFLESKINERIEQRPPDSSKLKPAQEVGRALNYSPDSIRTLISRGKFIAVKRGKEWFTHEKLFLNRGKKI